MKNKLFAGAIEAKKIIPGAITTETLPTAIVTETMETAIGIGIMSAKKKWPYSEGWYEHQATLLEVSKELIDKVVEK